MRTMKTTVYYSASADATAHRFRLDLPQDLDVHDSADRVGLVEECADDWHSNHDGWEAKWPRMFVLYESKEGPALERFEVDREANPIFSVSRT